MTTKYDTLGISSKLPVKGAAYIAAYLSDLKFLETMWLDPRVQCYDDAEMPKKEESGAGAVFLAGPTSRHQLLEYNWRAYAVEFLREAGWKGWIYVPEPRGIEAKGDFTDRDYIHRWESSRLLSSTHRAFWIPRKADELLGLNTNLEFGLCTGQAIICDAVLVLTEQFKAELSEIPLLREALLDLALPGSSKRLLAGWPHDAERMGLPNHYYSEIAMCERFISLRDLCFRVAGNYVPNTPRGDLSDDLPI